MKSIRTSIDIAAPPEKVWQVLTDFRCFGEWNPFIRSIRGSAIVGQRLTVSIAPPGKNAMTFKPCVLAVDAPRELRWKGKLVIRGVFDGEHHFKLTPNGAGTRLEHGEDFGGVLVPLFAGVLAATEQGFHAMNAALKRRVEGSA